MYIPKFSATSGVQYYVNQYAAVLPDEPTWKKRTLNWKLKISNTTLDTTLTSLSCRNVTLCIVECRK